MKVVLAFIAALPFVAQAETLFVQYEGVIVPSNAPLRGGYHIGDRVSGTLLIDSLLAPRTNVQPDNGFAFYQYPGPYGTDFVAGWVPAGKEARDFVIIERGRGPNLGSNSYDVVDANPERSVSVFAISPLIKTLDLVQTFDIREEDENGGMWGFFEWGREVVEQAVFRMTRFSVTPGRCRA